MEKSKANEIGRYLLVGAGKGGVGKSTVAVNLALGLSRLGAKVGLLDADIHGPSAHLMLGIQGRRPNSEGDMILPVISHGLPSMSIGLLVEPGQAMIWRGPMLAQALTQFLNNVVWGRLDYLIIDLPPGTGDVPLSISQSVEAAMAVLVSTPQEVALSDVRKAKSMFEKVGIDVLGIIENMSYFVCPHCDEETDIFDRGGAERAASEMGTTFLGAVPLHPGIRKAGDAGIPTMIADPDGPESRGFLDIAKKVAEEAAGRTPPTETNGAGKKPALRVIQ